MENNFREDPPFVAEVFQRLQEERKRKRIGCQIYFYPSVDSTNESAKDLILKGAPEGTILIADEQRKGKGRLGKTWSSLPGKGIWMSLILRPRIDPLVGTTFNIISSVVVAETIHRVISEKIVKVKWPNDVLIGEKKVCGILIETGIQNGKYDYLIVGIGLNVFHQTDDFPIEVRKKATSIRLNTKEKISRILLVSELLDRMERYYAMLESGETGRILKTWNRYNDQIGKTLTVYLNLKQITGKILGFDETGGIMIQVGEGPPIRLQSGSLEPPTGTVPEYGTT